MSKKHRKVILRKRLDELDEERHQWIKLSGPNGLLPSVDVLDTKITDICAELQLL